MMMKRLRWAMDGEFWELDLSTPATLDGVARPSGDAGLPLSLGLSRGTRLSRPKQIDFLQRFMAVPLLPAFSHGVGLSLQRLLSLPLPSNTLLVPFLLTYFSQFIFIHLYDCIYIGIYLLGLQHCSDSSMCKNLPPLSSGMGSGKPQIPIPPFCRVFGGIFPTPNCMPSISAPSGCSRLKTHSCLLQKQMGMPQVLETRPFFFTRWQPCMIIASLFLFCFLCFFSHLLFCRLTVCGCWLFPISYLFLLLLCFRVVYVIKILSCSCMLALWMFALSNLILVAAAFLFSCCLCHKNSFLQL